MPCGTGRFSIASRRDAGDGRTTWRERWCSSRRPRRSTCTDTCWRSTADGSVDRSAKEVVDVTSIQGVALVTGGGAGLGRACALTLGTRGARVAVHYRKSRDGAEEV